MTVYFKTKTDISKLNFDFSDVKEVKYFKQISKETHYIIERIKDLNSLKEIFIEYKNKKREVVK